MSFGAPHPFTLRQLQYAAAVADCASFRKAAERCHVSQPSLSAQIAELESGLGATLFERGRGKFVITPAGRELLSRARELLREADDLSEAARRAGDPLVGRLRIGVIPTLSPYLLPHLGDPLRQAHPELLPLWVEDKTSVLLAELATGRMDAALLALEADLGDVEREVVGVDPFVLATPVGHPLGKQKRPVRPEQLDGENVLLLDDGHCFREQALSFCASARACELEFRATSLSTLVQMVASGAGVTLLPTLALGVETSRARLCIRPFARPAPQRSVVLAWRRRSPLGPALSALADTLRDAYAERAAG